MIVSESNYVLKRLEIVNCEFNHDFKRELAGKFLRFKALTVLHFYHKNPYN